MHNNNITAEVLYSTRTLVSCSQRKSTFGAQSISFQAGRPNTARSRPRASFFFRGTHNVRNNFGSIFNYIF